MARIGMADIVKSVDLKKEEVEVAEWGGSVLMRELTSKERDHFEATSFVETLDDNPDKPGEKLITRRPILDNLRARLVALCMVDDAGNRLFGDDEVEVLGGKSAAVLSRLFTVAQRLNGLAAKAVEDAEKN